MKTKIYKAILPAILLPFIAVALIACRDEPPQPDYNAEQQAANAATRAPAFTLADQNGKPVNLSDFAGKITVLEWTNYDCPFVKYHYQHDTMTDLAQKYTDQGVAWLAINSTHYASAADNKAFANANNLPYPILDDHAATVAKAYGATTTPHIYIIDKHGRIAYNGAIDNAPMGQTTQEYTNYIDKTLTELTAGNQPSIQRTNPYGCPVKYRQ
ncbi:MAG: redoxin domain-containing protein [Planctomycetes bacterium]|nr:redoxin domain-containing protein [Planctomycetota bacterium]